MNKDSLQWPLGQKLVSAQGDDAVVVQRILDVDRNERLYRIQFAPYNDAAQLYYPSVAYTCFYKRGE